MQQNLVMRRLSRTRSSNVQTRDPVIKYDNEYGLNYSYSRIPETDTQPVQDSPYSHHRTQVKPRETLRLSLIDLDSSLNKIQELKEQKRMESKVLFNGPMFQTQQSTGGRYHVYSSMKELDIRPIVSVPKQVVSDRNLPDKNTYSLLPERTEQNVTFKNHNDSLQSS